MEFSVLQRERLEASAQAARYSTERILRWPATLGYAISDVLPGALPLDPQKQWAHQLLALRALETTLLRTIAGVR